MNKGRSAATLLVVSALALAGCSAGGAEPNATIDPNEEITLKVMSTTLAAEPEASAERAIGDAFMAEHPNVTLEYIPVAYNDYGTKLTTVATSRDVPDIFVNGPELAPRIADLGIAQDITDLLGEDYISGFDPAIVAGSQFDGALAYAPYYTIPNALVYRTDLFEEAGLTPPETWDDFKEVAKALTVDKNGDGSIDQWGFAMVGTANASGGARFAPVLRSFGSVELEQDGDGWATTVGNDASVEAYQLYADLVSEGVVPPGVLNTGFPDAVNLMASGQTAMMMSGSHVIGSIAAAGGSEVANSLAAVPVPDGGAGHQSSLGQLGFSVSATSEHPEAAAEYIKFFLEEQNQLAFTKATGRLPTRTDALASPELDAPQYKGFIDSLQYAYDTPPAPFYLGVQTITAEGFQRVINGTPAEEVVADVKSRIEQEIANNG